jgi:hypothetical protein
MNSAVLQPSTQIKARKGGALKLNGLPRFHPANYQAATTAVSSAPTSAPASTPRHYSNAQLQLHNYQRELIASATRSKTAPTGIKPVSPRLLPLGSPGPVTPLMLEEEGGYLVAGANNPNPLLGESGQRDLVERLLREESLRAGNAQTLVGGRR